MSTAKETVMGFKQAMGKGDWKGARGFLADEISFVGPFDTFSKPDDYLGALQKLHHIVEKVDTKKVFADGDDVCMLYDMVTNTPAGTAFISEWFKVKGGKIASVRVVFDARPFAPMFKK